MSGKTDMAVWRAANFAKNGISTIFPCASADHVRNLRQRLTMAGLKFEISARISKGIAKQPYKSRRSFSIKVKP